MQDKASCFVTNSPSWVIFGRHHSLLLALCSLDKPIFFLCCCSLVSPPRCSRLGSWVHRCVVILAWNNQFVFDLGKIQFKIVTHELLPSIFVVEENVFAYILQRLVSSFRVNLPAWFTTFFLEPSLKLLYKLPVFLFQLYCGKILLICALLVVEREK